MLAQLDMAVKVYFLLIPWIVVELFAIIFGVAACVTAFRSRSTKWQPLQLGVFPFLFGGASIIWFRADLDFSDKFWLLGLAAASCVLGVIAMLGSLIRRRVV